MDYTMEWKEWNGKEIFLRTKHGKVYSGKVIGVDDKDSELTWITIIDKFGARVVFVHSEITQIKEETRNGAGN
jgi:hypothetical protein